MKRIWLVFILIIFSLAACNANRLQVSNLASTQTVVQASPSKAVAPAETATPVPTDTLTPTVTDTPTLTPPPSRTPTQTALPFANAANVSIDEQRTLMNLVIDSGKWKQLGLPEQIASRWQAFAGGQADLTAEETRLMAAFLAQWGELTGLVEKSWLKNKAQFQFRTLITPDAQTGDHIAVYLIDETSGSLRYLLIVRDSHENPIGLLFAPEIEGLEERISPDGAYVEYFEPKGRTLLLADARKLDIDDLKEKKLRDRLEALYPNNNYFAYSSYPRYFLPGDEIQAGFYGLEESLSATQILQLNEAFALYNRPDLMVLKSAFFGPPVSVIITNDLGRAIGLTYTGTGVVEMDRQDLFGNKYWIAMVLAHEASHVLQGALPDKAMTCPEIEKREIGNHKIPDGFYNWTADELVQAVKDLRIGAYHVSLWMMNKLGIKNLQPFLDVIATGKVNGQSVVIDCKFSG
jgi:hypothetical protein